MLSATQIGNVPAEVKSAQRELLAIAEEVRKSWPPNQTEYRSDDVRKVVTSLNRSVAKLVESVSLAVEDPLIAESEGLVAQANRGNAELQKLQRALAIPAEQSRQAASVTLPALKDAIPSAMVRVAQVWGDLNTLHRVSLGWIGGTQADIIVQGYRDVLAAVQGMPGAKKIGFVGRHKKKIALGVVAVAASGAGTWWLLRRRRTMMLQAPEMDVPEEDLEIPVGIHFLPEGKSKLSEASELVSHIAGPDAAEMARRRMESDAAYVDQRNRQSEQTRSRTKPYPTSALPPGFEPFDVDEEEPSSSRGRPGCAEKLSAMSRGDIVRVGGERWEVRNARGTDVYVIKHGTKGRKLYKLVTVSLDPCEVEVQEVHPGSGDIMHNVSPFSVSRGELKRALGLAGSRAFKIGDLPRATREELFNLHATSVNPDATERSFMKKSVPSLDVDIANIDVSSYKDEDYFGKQDLANLPPIVIADGKLIDGGHRVAAAQRKGIKTLRAIDMTGLLDPESTGSIAELS